MFNAFSFLGDRAAIASAALLIHMLLFGKPFFTNLLPIGRRSGLKLLRMLERKLNRERRTPEEREFRGLLLTVLLLALSAATGVAMHLFFKQFPWGWLLEALSGAALLGIRPAVDGALNVAHWLKEGLIDKARQEFENTPWRHAAILDASSLVRGTAEETAIAACEFGTAPLCGYLLFGLPGMSIVCAAKEIAEAFGSGHSPFGASAWRIHAAIQAVPARLCAVLFVLAALVLPFGNVWQSAEAFAVAWRRPHRVLLLHVAGVALNVNLGGPLSPYLQVNAGALQKSWIGGAVMQPRPRDAQRSAILLIAVSFFLLALAGVLAA